MKSSPLSLRLIRSCALTILSLSLCADLSAQTFIYTFQAPTMQVNAGNAGLAVNSIYLYSKIDAAGTTDAIVKITNSTGGVTLSTFDNDNIANGGYEAAFQPTLVVPAGTAVNGYMEFTFTFIKTGTYNTTTHTGTLFPQAISVPATVLDDDGTLTGGTLKEYDELNLGTGQLENYSTTGGQLTYSTANGYFIGTNSTGTNYPGISTTATAVMFTVMNTNISSLVFRTGVISDFTTAPAGRVSSLAFYAPTDYPSQVLAVSPFLDFKGSRQGAGVGLEWQIADGNNGNVLMLERSIDGGSFQSVRSFIVSDRDFTYMDAALPPQGRPDYRLKLETTGSDTLYSTILGFPSIQGPAHLFKVYPSLISSAATIGFFSENNGVGSVQILDYGGRVVHQQSVVLIEGMNTIPFERPPGLPSGQYILRIQTKAWSGVQQIVLSTI